MTYYDAAVAVLRRARRPLTTQEIVALAMERGLITPKGKTPDATMSAALYRKTGADGELVKLASPGISRAQRGSVRWAVRKT